MKLKNISVTQIVRHVVQLAAFILFPGLFISTFSALEDIVKAVVNGTFSVSALSAQLVMVVGIFLITAMGTILLRVSLLLWSAAGLLAIPLKSFVASVVSRHRDWTVHLNL